MSYKSYLNYISKNNFKLIELSLTIVFLLLYVYLLLP